MVNPFRCYLSMVGECSVHYFMLIPKRNCAMYSKLNKGGKDPGCLHICEACYSDVQTEYTVECQSLSVLLT